MNKTENINEIDEWEEFEKEHFTPEEIAESDLRVAFIGELIKARDEGKIAQKQYARLCEAKQPAMIKALYPLGKTLAIVPRV
ncbi:putative HTH-type transcriptional regulator [Clostridia bacterium]|nr:putative HTH-type transcriptional regulator [Clostridia bacterium]